MRLPTCLAASLALLSCACWKAVDAQRADSGAVPDAAGTPDAEVARDADEPCTRLHTALDEKLSFESQAEGHAGGAVAAVITPECGRWVGAVGEAEAGVALEAGRLLRIGSVTKTFTAATTLTLVADGLVSLDDTLDGFVAGFPNGHVISIRQLLNHTAGTFDIVEDGDFMAEARANPSRVYTPAELVSVAAAHAPAFEPGAGWGYSNTNYLLLGLVIEAATGQSAAAAIRERALTAAGLERTYLEGAEELPEALAPGYDATGTDVTGLLPPTIRWTAGAMVTEVGDTATWIATLARGDLLPAAEQAAMLTSVPIGAGERACGLGIFFLEIEGVGPAMGHSGSTPGYHAIALYVPALDAAAVAIINRDGADPNRVAGALLAAVAEAE